VPVEFAVCSIVRKIYGTVRVALACAGVLVAVVVGCSVAGIAGLLVAAVCWFRYELYVASQ